MSGSATHTVPPHLACLAQALDVAERRAVELLLTHPGAAAGLAAWPQGDLSDHKAAVVGDLADALQLLMPGAGDRLMRIVFPEHHLLGDEETLDVSTTTALAALLTLLGDPDLPGHAEPDHLAPARLQ